MRLFAGFLLILSLYGQDKPLTKLPYTPSLDIQFMDKTADPCMDFYKYACGNWNKLNPIPADQAGWNVYAKLTDEGQRYLWGILEEASRPSAARTANEQKIGDLFHACMDEGAVEQAGLKPLEPVLEKIADLKSVEDLAGYVGAEHRNGIDQVLFSFGSDQDLDNSAQMIAVADAGGLGLPDRDYYSKTDAKSVEIRQRYLQHVQKMLMLLGEGSPEAQADAQSVMTIETALAGASLTRVEQRDPYSMKHKMSREDLQHLMPAFNLDVYLSTVGAPEFDVVNVTQPKFYGELNKQLGAQNMTAWRAYLRWHLLHSNARFLAAKFVQEDFDFNRAYLRGIKQISPRWKRCTQMIDYYLSDALGQVYVARTFSPQTKQAALQMTQQIEAQMGSEIKELNWMSETTKQQALEKLHTVINKIGYPDKWRDYSSVQITPQDYLADAVQVFGYEERRQLQKIGKPLDRSEWFIPPTMVDAYYSAQMNDINFPAGVLQPPLFDPKMDAAPNYGNTGATIGHELTHGFDDEGRQFDAKGNLKDWWTAEDAKKFEERVGCVRNQYAKYIAVDDLHVNSSLTLGEDVADLGGTLLAYMAWKRATEGQDLKPADGLTPDQRFFVGMGQWACGAERPENLRMRVTTDPHSPEQFRINGVVSNLPQFGEAFGCKVGQPMMRAEACRVW